MLFLLHSYSPMNVVSYIVEPPSSIIPLPIYCDTPTNVAPERVYSHFPNPPFLVYHNAPVNLTS